MTVRANIMVRKSRSDKKDTTCKRCDKVCVNPNKLREHLRQKNPCRLLSEITASIQVPIQVPIQVTIQVPKQVISAKAPRTYSNITRKTRRKVIIKGKRSMDMD